MGRTMEISDRELPGNFPESDSNTVSPVTVFHQKRVQKLRDWLRQMTLFGPPLKFKTFPDGGRAAWSVVGGVFVSYGLAFGLLRVFSVLLNPIQSYYGVSQTTA